MRFILIEEVLETDSEGNTLTKEQIEFFKDSKVRDSEGRLLVCYHGAKSGGFDVFDPRGKSGQFGKYKFGRNNINFFTTSKDTALGYTDIGVEENGNIYSVYLNITNPFILTSERVEDMFPNTWNNIKNKQLRDRQIRLFDKFWKKWKYTDEDDEDTIDDINDDLRVFNFELRYNGNYFDVVKLEENTKFGKERVVLHDYSIEELFDPDMYDEVKEQIIGSEEEDYLLTTNDIVRNVLDMNRTEGTSYDGIIIKDIMDVGPTGSMFGLPQNTVITLKDSNQIKSITNKTPTDSDNINEDKELEALVKKKIGMTEEMFDEQDIIKKFWSLSTEELKKYIYEEDLETGFGGNACWITPSGDEYDCEYHGMLPSSAFYRFCDERLEDDDDYDIVLNDDMFSDHLVDDLGWMKYNDGEGFYDDRVYVVIPRKVTPQQQEFLENVIKNCERDDFLVLTVDGASEHYNPQKDDILHNIKEYSRSGILECVINEVYPNKGESKKDFIARFMSVTKDEYPDIKQRYAVALSYWDRRNKK